MKSRIYPTNIICKDENRQEDFVSNYDIVPFKQTFHVNPYYPSFMRINAHYLKLDAYPFISV